jgi:hypothetical protein
LLTEIPLLWISFGAAVCIDLVSCEPLGDLNRQLWINFVRTNNSIDRTVRWLVLMAGFNLGIQYQFELVVFLIVMVLLVTFSCVNYTHGANLLNFLGLGWAAACYLDQV